MVLRIRLQRFGQKKAPFYHIVCTNARTARQSRPIEMLGTYDPIPRDGVKDVALNMDRTKYWLGVGAQPSDTAARVLEKVIITLLHDIRCKTDQTDIFLGKPLPAKTEGTRTRRHKVQRRSRRPECARGHAARPGTYTYGDSYGTTNWSPPGLSSLRSSNREA